MRKLTALLLIFVLIFSAAPVNTGYAEADETIVLTPEASCRDNLLFKDDFEGDLSKWVAVANVGADNYHLSPIFQSQGTWSLVATHTSDQPTITLRNNKINVTGGEIYTVLFDFFEFSGTGIRISARAYSGGTRVFSQSVPFVDGYKIWQSCSLVFQLPKNAQTLDIYINGADKSQSTVFVDNIRIYKGAVEGESDLCVANQKLLKTNVIQYENAYDMPAFTPTIEHPRLYFNKDDIETIKKNASHPQNKSAYRRLLTEISSTKDGKLSSATGDNLDDKLMGIIQAKAFYYAIWKDEAKGREAVSMLNNFLLKANPLGSEYNSQGYLVFTIAAVYDWCYPLLTAEDKKYFQNAGLVVASTMEIGYPPKHGSVFNGHSAEAQLLRDQMAFAIAVFNDRRDIYRDVAGRFFEESVDTIKFLAEAKSSPYGNSYMTYRNQWESISLFMMDALGLPNIYGENHKDVMRWLLYARRPDGSSIHDGDSVSNNQTYGQYDKRGTRAFFLAGNYYKDPYLKGEFLRHNNGLIVGENTGNQSLSSIEVLCFNDPDVEYKSVKELPLSAYFPSPRGDMIARTGWEDGIDAPAVVAQMKVGEYWTQGHDHLDSGEFEIYYKGALANDTGYYQAGRDGSTNENSGNTVYGTVHFYNYHRRTIAHNCMLVYDPNEDVKASYKGYSNDGGQIFANNENSILSVHQLNEEKSHVAKVMGQEFGPDILRPDYTYLKGDLAKAYGNKVPEYERSFMFLNLKNEDHPAAMVVFDRVVAKDKTFDKKWVLHGLNMPEINGTRTVFKDTRKGYNGKLTVDTLLPKADNFEITTVGKEDWSYTGSDKKKYIGQSFMVDGTDYWVQALTGKYNEGGGFRIEISPKEDATKDYFLNVLQVADADSKKEPLNSEMIECSTHTGVKIADRVVMFGKEKARVSGKVSFEISGEGAFKFMVADLKAGTWQINRNGENYITSGVSEEGGVAYFEGEEGTYELIYLGNEIFKFNTAKPLPETEGINLKLEPQNKFVYSARDPFTKNYKTFVSAGSVMKALGADISYNQETGAFTAVKNTTSIEITKDKSTAFVNGSPVDMEEPALIKDGDLMAPLEFIADSLNYTVKWDKFSNTAILVGSGKLTYDSSAERITASSSVAAYLYVATYDGKKLNTIKKYTVSAGRSLTISLPKGSVAYLLDKDLLPLCESFKAE